MGLIKGDTRSLDYSSHGGYKDYLEIVQWSYRVNVEQRSRGRYLAGTPIKPYLQCKVLGLKLESPDLNTTP